MRHEFKELRGSGETDIRIYDSLSEFIQMADDYLADSTATNHQQATTNSNYAVTSSSFVGRPDLGEWNSVKQKANETWSDGLEIVERFKTDLAGKIGQPVSRRRRRCWSEDGGDDICLDRMRSGQPFWRSSHRPHVRGPQVISLVATQQTSASVKSSNILWRGAAMLALATVLEEAGYRCELWGAIAGRNVYGRNGMLLATRLKASGSPLDQATLTNAVSGWFYRTVGFVNYCATPTGLRVKSHLGEVMGLSSEMLNEFAPDAHVIDNATSYDKALSVCQEILSKVS